MNITRVFDILEHLQSYAPKTDLLNAKRAGQWQAYSLQDFINHSQWVAAALLQLGIAKGDNVAIMAGNRPEWNFVDFGCQQVGMPTVPIYPTISHDDLLFILNHSEAKLIFIQDKVVMQKIQAIRAQLKYLKHIICFDDTDAASTFDSLVAMGKAHFDAAHFAEMRATVLPTDLYTILYTSGTTGIPKGVMISHSNMLSNVMICKGIAPFTNQWRALSFLPLNHVYERFLNTLYLYHGVSIFYAESIDTIGENCREIKPQIFVAVPRVLEKVLERISTAGEGLNGFKKLVFDWSMRVAMRYELCNKNGWFYDVQRKVCDALVYKKWRAAVGGQIAVIVSGGAALNPKLERIFTCAGLPMLQGYGLTETCVVISVNRWHERQRQFGSVGLVVENSIVKIAEEDGEILMKGPSQMMGYYKNTAATAEVIDSEGWLHTGDVGVIDSEGFLKITDRKKEIFKNSAGKYIAPSAIENKLKESKYIEQCMVIGEGQKFASALIICNMVNCLKQLSLSETIRDAQAAEVVKEQIKNLIASEVKIINQRLAPFEQIKRYRILNTTWSIESGEITPKLSLRRKVILGNNKEVIAEIFGSQD
ncbi:MAG: long-chain fatty acid--CoA ligase [Chitinophagaceae bacterium]|nr:long-chain fatty acid--CoA ligase [Chitinophagaceae bacterium]